MFGRRQVKARSERSRGELGKRIDRLRHAAGTGARAASARVRPTLASGRVKVAPSAAWVRTAAAQGWGGAAAVVALLPLMAAARRSATKANRRDALQGGKLARMTMMARTGKTAGRGKARVIGKGSRMSGTRTGLLVGLLVGGGAAGVAGALMSRRRIRAQWEEHESPAAGEVTSDVPPVRDATESPEDASLDKAAGRLATGSDRAADEASSWSDSAKDPASKRSKAAGNTSTGADQPSVTLTFGEAKDKADQLAEGAATG